jgi:hypothetical protein
MIDPASIKPSFAGSFFIRPTRDGVSKDLFPEAGDNNAFHTFHTFRYSNSKVGFRRDIA